MMLSQESKLRNGRTKSAKCKPRNCREMRRTQLRRSDESNCGNAAAGESLRRHQEWFGMKIWVDADACPAVIKDILFRAAKRTGVALTLVANHSLRIPPSPCIRFLQVSAGFDVADKEIVKRLDAGDLVITGDIPLAAEVIEKGGHALTPRGELYSVDNIREHLVMRDFMDTLRASGIDTGGPAALSQKDRQSFANQLDQFLTRHARNA
jgi:uncharacterized protein YaiI (UPF0178 family)